MNRTNKKDCKAPPARSIKDALCKISGESSTSKSKKSLSALIESQTPTPVALMHASDSEEGIDITKDQTDSRDSLVSRFETKFKSYLQTFTTQVMAEIRDIGDRISSVEDRLDDVENLCLDQGNEISELKEANLSLQLKLEDMENRSRRSNIRIRGIPEHVKDSMATATALFQELAPNIPLDRLELDRAHRALTKIKPGGPPRDIVVKCHYFRTKEALLQKAREKSNNEILSFQSHQYQLFADLAPSTIARRREMKPSLQLLISHNITYKWGFPFKLLFHFQGTWYSASTPQELSSLLNRLHLQSSSSTKRLRDPATPDTSHNKSSHKKPSIYHSPSSPALATGDGVDDMG